MTKWYIIQAKFSDEAYGEIQKVMRKRRIKNPSQFVKKAIEEYLGIPVADVKRKEYSGLPLEYTVTYHFYEYLKRSFRNSPENQKEIERLFLLWANGFFSIHTRKRSAQLDEANRLWDIIKAERKIGRPKATKKPVGRPRM